MDHDKALRKHLVNLLTKAEAHADFEKAVKGLAPELRGQTPPGAEHSAWELVEHIRITLWDILDFSRNPEYKEREWPAAYWPTPTENVSDAAWDKSIEGYRGTLKEMCDLVTDESTDLFAKIPHGDGQTVLREAMLAADHTSYHVGQLVLVRRLLGAWG